MRMKVLTCKYYFMRTKTIGITAMSVALWMASPAEAAKSSSGGIPEGMSRLVLEAHDVFGDGATGYQWLLDSDHSAYNEEFFPSTDRYFGNYDSFEFSLPEGAECRYPTSTVVVDGEIELLVEAGVYDWMVVRPCDEGMMFPYGDFVLVDDFEFLPGATYRMSIRYLDGEKGPGDYATLSVPQDVSLEALTVPLNGVGLGEEEIYVTLFNMGSEPISDMEVSYSVNSETVATEKIQGVLAPGESLDYKFVAKADLSAPGIYDIEASVKADGDMLSSNNTRKAVCRNMESRDLPYGCDFSKLGAEEFDVEWIVTDGNRDGNTWMFSEWVANRDGVMGVASCSGSTNGDRVGDDWLISQPFAMKRGKGHVAFTTRSVMDTQMERVEVCVGDTPYPESMRVVGTYDVCSLEWLSKGLTFDVEADGVYYVALHAVSQNGYNLFVGDVTVGEGEFKGKPAVRVEKLLVPYSNCDLPADAKVGMRVTNVGTAALENYSLECTVNSETSVRKDFTVRIEPGETADIVLDDVVDFSETGEYAVELRLQSDEIDEIRTVDIECYEPILEKPVYTSFTKQENADIWQSLTDDGWYYEEYFSDFSAQKHGRENGLLCRGISFSHPVRVRMSYVAAGWDSSALGIYLGKSGEDVESYVRIYEDAAVGNEPRDVEFTAEIPSAGNYSLMIADEGEEGSRSFIRLNEILISEVMPHDLAIERFDGPVSLFMPSTQLGSENEFIVEVANRGSEPMSGVKVRMSVDADETGVSQTVDAVAPGESVRIPVRGMLPAKKVGERFSLSFEVLANEEDGLASDNILSLEGITVTETQRSTENITELVYGTGNNGDPLAIGNVYCIGGEADLTSVTVGLCPTESDTPNAMGEIALNIYSLDADDGIERCIYSERRERGTGGFVDFDVPDMRLGVGRYYFEVEQLSGYNMGLALQQDESAVCWERTGNELTRVEGAGYALCIRAEFGPDSRVYAKDAWVRSIYEPTLDEALFSQDETVRGEVRNNGYEEAGCDVELLLDGERVATRSLSLQPYESALIDFSGIDLSRAGVHDLELKAVMADDANPSNDSLVRHIVTSEEADPYVMDFEACNDFDAAGDRLNPRWTTVDRNGVRTTLFWRYEHRHRGDACGFMAFNILSTVPSMSELPLENFEPHSGDRFGVAFVFSPFEEGGDALEQADIWMISPKLSLGSSSSFDFYVRTRLLESPEADLEPYRVLVSETDIEPESFRVIGEDVRLASLDGWEAVSVDLSEYDGKDVYVAIQYIGKPFINTCLMIDDLRVNTNVTGVPEVVAAGEPEIAYDGDRGVVIMRCGSAAAVLGIYSSDGLKVASGEAGAMNVCDVDVRGLRPGVYVARASGDGGNSVLKFVVR